MYSFECSKTGFQYSWFFSAIAAFKNFPQTDLLFNTSKRSLNTFKNSHVASLPSKSLSFNFVSAESYCCANRFTQGLNSVFPFHRVLLPIYMLLREFVSAMYDLFQLEIVQFFNILPGYCFTFRICKFFQISKCIPHQFHEMNSI